jgi:hypothetical protein
MYQAASSEDPQDASAAIRDAWIRSADAPENEMPAGLDFGALLGKSDETAVYVTGFRVFSTGLAFTLSVRLRRDPRQELSHRIHELLSGHITADADLDERLLLGVQYADGRTATNLTAQWPPHFADEPAEATEPRLTFGAGGGGGRTYDQDIWLSPVPPAGPMTLICRWPAFGIEESQTELDGAQLNDALARVQVLWPWEPPEHEPEPEPTSPQLPPDGWFADTQRRDPTGR